MAASLAEENLLLTDDFNRQVSTCFWAADASLMIWFCLVCESGFAPAYVHSSAKAGLQCVPQVTHELTDGWGMMGAPRVWHLVYGNVLLYRQRLQGDTAFLPKSCPAHNEFSIGMPSGRMFCSLLPLLGNQSQCTLSGAASHIDVGQCCAMLCYAMLCYAMLCYAMLCYAMPCHAMLCHAMLCHAMLCHAMLCHATLCHATLCYAMLCYALLCYAVLCYAVLCRAMPRYAMLRHVICCAVPCRAVLRCASLCPPASVLPSECRQRHYSKQGGS